MKKFNRTERQNNQNNQNYNYYSDSDNDSRYYPSDGEYYGDEIRNNQRRNEQQRNIDVYNSYNNISDSDSDTDYNSEDNNYIDLKKIKRKSYDDYMVSIDIKELDNICSLNCPICIESFINNDDEVKKITQILMKNIMKMKI